VYARNLYHDEFLDYPPRSYSRALPRTSSHALPRFSHGPNHRSYGFGSQENNFVPRRFGYNPRPYHGDHLPCRPSFLLEGLALTFSLDTWTVHVLPDVVHVLLGQMVRFKGL
jgi:hypothetical protein